VKRSGLTPIELLVVIAIAAALAHTTAFAADAPLCLPRVFGSGMVLQSGRKLPVWGWAAPGDTVVVRFAGQSRTARVDDHGQWRTTLAPLNVSSEPATMTVAAQGREARVEIRDVLVGEVWLCAGQSNMEMPMGKVDERTYRGIEEYETELESAGLPRVRFLNVPHASSGLPVPDVSARWYPSTPEHGYWFPAVAFTFARKLHQEAKIPVGIICAAWGGSPVQPWTPRSGFEAMPETFGKELAQISAADSKYFDDATLAPAEWRRRIVEAAAAAEPVPPSKDWNARPPLPVASGHPLTYPRPAALYNAMVAPVAPYGIRGVLWFQGESNKADGAFYACRLEALTTGWRREWGQRDLPFILVELVPAEKADGTWSWYKDAAQFEAVRDAQRTAAKTLKNVKLVPTAHLNDPDIHSRNKRPIGERAAEIALENWPPRPAKN
jgi:sialate O-acetylesterase